MPVTGIKSMFNWNHLSQYIAIEEIHRYPDLPWSKQYLSMNKNITINSIDDYNWRYLSQYISIKEVRAHPEHPWDRVGLSQNKDITLNDVETLSLPNATRDWNWVHSLDTWL